MPDIGYREGFTLESGCVTPGAWYGKKCHPGDCGYVKPCTGSGGWGHTETLYVRIQVQDLVGALPWRLDV